MKNNFIKQEKELLNRALKNQLEDPTKQCFKRFHQLVFKNHPYAMDPMGTTTSLKKLTQKYLLNLHKKNIRNKKIVFTYCGDLTLTFTLSY